MNGVEVFQVPVEAELGEFMEAYEVWVPTEYGTAIQVNVMRNLVRRTYEVEFTDALLEMAPQGLTATIQMVMLALQERLS